MPQTAAPTSLFEIETREISAKDGLTYVVDKLSETNLLKATYGKILNAAVVPGSLLANDVTTYTVTFTPTHDIVKFGKIAVTLPKECSVNNPTNTRTHLNGSRGSPRTRV